MDYSLLSRPCPWCFYELYTGHPLFCFLLVLGFIIFVSFYFVYSDFSLEGYTPFLIFSISSEWLSLFFYLASFIPVLWLFYFILFLEPIKVYKTYTIGAHKGYWRYCYPVTYPSGYYTGRVLNPGLKVPVPFTQMLCYKRYSDACAQCLLPGNRVAHLPLVLVRHTLKRVLLFSEDVIHTFTVPDLGIKWTCAPGQLTEEYIVTGDCGVFYGYCSEAHCSKGHFMPITIEVVGGLL